MGDNHFLLQNTLTGIIFFAFAIIGIWFIDPNLASTILALSASANYVPYIVALATTPIVGLLMQGVWGLLVFLSGHYHYEDPGRKLIATKIRTAANSIKDIPEALKEGLRKAPDDSLFVWFYYSAATDKLIEWARRRRDFQHIGENFISGTVCGVVFGFAVGAMLHYRWYTSRVSMIILFIVVLVGWVVVLLYLRLKLKKDADSTEQVWLCAELYPDLRHKIVSVKNSSHHPTTS